MYNELLLADIYVIAVMTAWTEEVYNHLFEMFSLSLKIKFGCSCPHVPNTFKLRKLEVIVSAKMTQMPIILQILYIH